MKNNNKFRWKRTATGVSIGLLLMCNTATAQVEGAQPEQDQNTFTLNLKNTDINSLIATVSKQTGRNFVVDPRVKAKVTVISTDPVSADGLYEVFLSVLQVHGYSAVPAGDLIKIVPDVTAKQGPVPILGEDSNPSDQLVTQVIAVVNVPAAQLVPILRPMVPQQGHLAAYAATNSLIVTDRASNIQRLMEIIRRIDRPDNEEIEVVRLNHAAASEIVGTLNSLQSNNVGGPQGPGAIQLVADDRTNSVLISGDRAARVRVRGLIAHLDTPIESGGNTRVVYLKFANAEDMVTILQGVSQGQAAVGATTTDSGGAPNVTPPVQPTPQGQQPANNVAQRPQNNAVTPRSAAETGESSVDIQADPNTNALIITAPPDEMQNILAVVRQLDIRRAQVLVEAVIAEITEDNTREFGINFLLDGTDSDAPVGFSNLGGGTDGALGIAGALESGLPPASLGAGLSLALGRFGSGEIDFGFLVRAIASDADNNILSTPSIVTLDNEEAEIIVGENVPFVTGQQLSTNNDNPFQTVERQDIGLTLKVKPQINDGNTIKMELEQEVSSVNPTAVTGAADITTSKRSIKTTVLVDDGQTLVLGGLIDDQISDVEEKVPLLGDIPVLGRLFRFRTTTKTKQNLMIFLHPVILRDNDSATQLSNSKYNSLRSRQRFFQQQKNNSVIKEEQELPELKLFFEGRNIVGPQTSLDAPVAPDGPQSIAKLADGTGVKGLSVAGGSATTSPAPADIEQVISAYNAEQADEILAGNTADDDAKPVEINTDNKPDLPAIYLQLAESISPTATVPAAVTTVTQAETDQETQQPAAIVAAAQTEEEAVKEIPASSRSKKLNGVSVTFNEEHNAPVPPAVVEPLVKEPIAEVAAVEPVIEETISEPSVDETANVEPVAEDVVETPDLATDEPTADQVAIAEPVSEDNVAPLEDVDHAAVEQAMDKLLADLTTVETVIEENITLTDDAEQAAVEQAMDELLAELSTTETVIEDNAAIADELEQTAVEQSVDELLTDLSITETVIEETDALADDLEPITAEPVIDELVTEVAAEPVTDNLLPESPVIDEQLLEIVETIAVAPEYVDNIDSDIVDRSQDNLDDDRPEVVILSVKANGEPANDFDIDKFWDMQRTPRY